MNETPETAPDTTLGPDEAPGFSGAPGRPSTKLEALDTEADRLVEAGAPAAAFEDLVKRGWRPRSYRIKSDKPCPSDCGVCHPVFPVRRRAA